MTQPDISPLQALPLARKRLIFLCLLGCMFLAMLDHQIISTAMPSIMADLGGMEKFGWIGAAYLVTHSAIMPISGKLGDLFGRKRVLMASVVIFACGSAACGWAGTTNGLIAARLLQGLGAGGIMVSVVATNGDLFDRAERAKYQSFTSLVMLLAASVGPFVGGVMTEYFGWRSIFLINLPLGAIMLGLLIWLLPHVRPNRRPQIDYWGAMAITALVGSLVVWADSPQLFGGWLTLPAALLLGAMMILAFAFWTWEKRVEEPVLSPTLLANPVILRLLLIAVCTGTVALGISHYHALYLQMTTGLTPAKAGSFFLALVGGMTLGSMLTGRYVARTGRYKPPLCLGLTIAACSLAIMAMLPPAQPLWVLAVMFFCMGLGNGFGQQIPTIFAQNQAPYRDLGAVTGAVSLFRLTGAALATSIYGTVLNLGLPQGVTQMSPDTWPAIYTAAYLPVYGLAVVIILVALALALTLPPDRPKAP